MNMQHHAGGICFERLSVGLCAIFAIFLPWNSAFAPIQEAKEVVRTVFESQQIDMQNPMPATIEQLTTSTLYIWSGGVLEPQQYPNTGYTQTTYYAPCTSVTRFTSSLTGDITETSYGLSGTFQFTPSSPLVVYFRFILVHQGAEQILVEYPLNLHSGTQTFTGFTQTGPDPAAGLGDALILEIDPRGLVGNWRMYFGGESGASVTIPEAAVAAPANFSKHVLESTYPSATSVSTIDLDGDGDMDIVAANYSAHEIAWWENIGSRNYVKYIIDSNVNFFFPNPGCLAAADIDGDGDIDVVAATGNSTVTWWENTAGQAFARHIINLTSAVNSPQIVLPVDLDQDGDLDILVTVYSKNLRAPDSPMSFGTTTASEQACLPCTVLR